MVKATVTPAGLPLTGVGQLLLGAGFSFAFAVARAQRFCPNYGIRQNIGVSLI